MFLYIYSLVVRSEDHAVVQGLSSGLKMLSSWDDCLVQISFVLHVPV